MRMPVQLYKLEVSLTDCHTVVSRTIIVPAEITLDALHVVIQRTMGWRNSHSHEFQTSTKRSSQRSPRDIGMKRESRCALRDVVNARRKSFLYIYDLGDEWVHQLKITDFDCKDASAKRLFSCIAGEGACPPEDVGGVVGYKDFCEAVNDLNSSEYDELREWAYKTCCYPEDQTWPDGFDLARVNESLGDFDKWFKRKHGQVRTSVTHDLKIPRADKK